MEDRVMVPDGLPSLKAGSHQPGYGEACVMELVSVIAGEQWTDHPQCVHHLLAEAAIGVNDYLQDKDRDLIRPHIGRFFGTAVPAYRKPLLTYFGRWVHSYHGGRGDSQTVKVSLLAAVGAEVHSCSCDDCYHPERAVEWLSGALDVVEAIGKQPPRLVTVADVARVREVVHA